MPERLSRLMLVNDRGSTQFDASPNGFLLKAAALFCTSRHLVCYVKKFRFDLLEWKYEQNSHFQNDKLVQFNVLHLSLDMFQKLFCIFQDNQNVYNV
jgi:hypothetical protein